MSFYHILYAISSVNNMISKHRVFKVDTCRLRDWFLEVGAENRCRSPPGVELAGPPCATRPRSLALRGSTLITLPKAEIRASAQSAPRVINHPLAD